MRAKLSNASRLGSLTLLALLVANGMVTFRNLATIVASQRWTDHTHEVVTLLERTISTLKDAELGQRGYLLTGDLEELAPYRQATGAIDPLLDRLQGLTADNPGQQARIAALRQEASSRLALIAQTLALSEAGDPGAALELVRTLRGRERMDQVRRSVAVLIEVEQGLMAERAAAVEAAVRRTSVSFSIVNGAALLLLLGLSLLQAHEGWAHRRAAAAIRQSEQWLRTTLASIADGVVATDATGLVRFLNPVAESLTGWTSAEATGRPLSDVIGLIHEATRAPVENPVDRVLREGRVVELANHTLLVARDGQERPIEDSAAPIRGPDGAIGGVVLVFRDATERRQAQAALQRSEEHLRLIVESAADYAILSIDLQSHITSWNAGARAIFGYEPAEILGRPVDDLFLPEDRERGVPGLEARRALETGRAEDERWHLRRDGSTFWASGLLMPMRDGDRVLGWLKILRDSTVQKRTEQELELSRARLDLVVNSSEVGLWYCDLPFGLLLWNAKCKQHFGLPADAEVTLDVFYERLAPEDRDRTRQAIAAAIDERAEFDIEYRTIGLDGRARWIRAIGRAYYDVDDHPIRFDGITVDVSERIRQEAALREADRKKDEFLATLAHELRNPLAPIRNALHLMAAAGDPDHRFEEERAMADRQVAHLARLIEDLMDVARISSGKIELRKAPVDLAAVVSRTVASARPAIAERGHQLQVQAPENPVWLEGDATRLEQVLWNLLNNAARYTEPGGQITLASARDGDQAVVRVRDTGIGITPELLPRVFDMFVQADPAERRTQGGLGIGLGLARTLVELHGGTITVHSDGPGRGCEFTVRLPALPETEPASRRPASDQPARGGSLPRRRILVVDDNRDAAVSLARLLERHYGQEVRVAHDGPSALSAADTFLPEAVLLDIRMPGMDGLEVARRLRQRPEFERTLLVAVTGWGQEADRRQSERAGFNRHLVKPVDPAELQNLLADPAPTPA